MNKLTIPSILAATVLIAGIFAFMPVEKASTLHTGLEAKLEAVENEIKGEINKNKFFLETVNLSDLDDGTTVVVADTTPHGMGQVHIAATLPVADVGTDGCTDEEPLVDVKAGKAPNLDIVLTGAHNTGIEGRTDFDPNGVEFGATDDMCVFHRTITVANVDADSLTNIVVEGKVGALPADAFITVSGTGLMDDAMGLLGEISIGLLTPRTGDFASFGEENLAGTRLGVVDFNEHLEGMGAPWNLRIVEKDTATNTDTTLEKLKELDAEGIRIVIGPGASANVNAVREYANSNNILLVSTGSTSPTLTIAGDNVFRLVPDDNKQGTALAELIKSEGIDVLVPVWRNDVWGNGLKAVVADSFVGKDGQVDDGIRYDPESPGVSDVIDELETIVQGRVTSDGADNVAVLFVGFDEILEFLTEAADHAILDDVRWFGSDANTKQQLLTNDRIASDFSTEVEFTSLQFTASKSAIYERVKADLGGDPGIYAYASYDAVWVIGLTMLDTQSTDALTIKGKLPEIAETYSGAIGSTRLNTEGDLEQADYDIWGIRGGDWELLGKYTESTGRVVLT
jgi:branched-chain amino acid transport system substrate-binding protein